MKPPRPAKGQTARTRPTPAATPAARPGLGRGGSGGNGAARGRRGAGRPSAPAPGALPPPGPSVAAARGPRVLITAGPTHEPIDRVRFIGNRSSGKMGISIAQAAAAAGWRVRLLLGPVPTPVNDPAVKVERFQTTEELRTLLTKRMPSTDVLVMAAAVADYRPDPADTDLSGKIRRKGQGLTLRLVSTPDLLQEVASGRRPGQVLVGFALEPRQGLEAVARAKLERKGVDFIVANPLETMDAADIDGVLVGRDGATHSPGRRLSKGDFAAWLIARLTAEVGAGPRRRSPARGQA